MNASFARRLFHAALFVCPSGFRAEYGPELEADFDERPSLFAGLRIAGNLIVTGILLHLENLGRDLALALRTLSKSPVFAIVSIAAIALAIGVNVAVGSITEHVLVNPLPYADASRLVYVYGTDHGKRTESLAYPDVADLGAGTTTLSGLAALTGSDSQAMTGRGTPLAVHGAIVSGNYFDVMGIRPELGRVLGAADVGKRTIVISDELWHRRFSADPAAIGSTVSIGDIAYKIAGVAPPHTASPMMNGMLDLSDYWRTFNPHVGNATQRDYWAWEAIGRLAPGATVSAANADLARIAAGIARAHPNPDRNRGVYVTTLTDAVMGEMDPILYLLHVAVLVVFLVAAANVTSLLLARATARERELSVRLAIGATKRRIASQLAAETGVLAVAGSAIGVLLGWLALRWLVATVSRAMPPGWQPPGFDRLGIDGPLLAYVVVLAAVFTLMVGLLPALASRRHLATSLSGGGSRADAAAANRVRRVLVTLEMTMAFVLVFLAGLMLHSFVGLQRIDVGFDGSNLYWVEFGALPQDRYSTRTADRAFVERLSARIRAVPGVLAATEGAVALFASNEGSGYRLPGQSNAYDANRVTDVDAVDPGYFATVGIPLLRGRGITAADTAGAQPVVVVSRRFAMDAFGTLDAVGREVSIGMSSDGTFPMRRVVGVVGDVRHSLSAPPPRDAYLPFAQVDWSRGYAVRTDGRIANLATAMTDAVRAVDPLMPPPQVTSFADMRAFNEMPNDTTGVMLTALAGIALLIALSGIYGIVSYAVERRTREFGIRMALGARAAQVLLAVVRESLVIAAIAVVCGALISALCTRVLGDFLVDTSSLDTPTLAVVIVLIFGCTLAACVGPARKAMSTDPSRALRYE